MPRLQYYVMPYLFTNFWLVLYTKLHHTHLALPHYGYGGVGCGGMIMMLLCSVAHWTHRLHAL